MSYQVELEVFNGPMDLLLYLISKEEVDITEVSIARIVDQYMEYLDRMRDLNVDVTSDFIVMASTLMLIKSKTLLPTEEIDLDEEIDQQDELIHHLLEYKKIKVLSRGLKSKAERQHLLFPRPSLSLGPGEDSSALDEVSLWDILRAFARIIKETGMDRPYRVIHTERPLSSYIAAVIGVLRERQSVPFEALFTGEKTRDDAICIFIGLLELVKRSVIAAYQNPGVNEIHVALLLDEKALDEIRIDGVYRLDLLGEEEPGTEGPASPPDAEHRGEEEPPGSDAASGRAGDAEESVPAAPGRYALSGRPAGEGETIEEAETAAGEGMA